MANAFSGFRAFILCVRNTFNTLTPLCFGVVPWLMDIVDTENGFIPFVFGSEVLRDRRQKLGPIYKC